VLSGVWEIEVRATVEILSDAVDEAAGAMLSAAEVAAAGVNEEI
jgi:hypothetical protein